MGNRLYQFLFASAVIGLSLLPYSVRAQTLTLQNTYSLDNSLATPNFNFNPQGIGYDSTANELLFVQQNSDKIYRTDLTGNIVGSVAKQLASDGNGVYSTAVAADANYYYYSDYGSNNSGFDLFRIAKTNGVADVVGSETAGYGGDPIDVRNGLLYRTESSTTYGYNDLATVRVSSLAAPDTTTQTLNLSTPDGIADFAVDGANNSLWVMSYSPNASIYRYDLSSGSLLHTYNLNLQGVNGGMTFANNTLYYYNWQNGSGSTLSTYQFTSAAVPEPGVVALLLSGLGSAGFFLRRRRK